MKAKLTRGELSEANRTWLAQCGLTPEQIQNQIEPEYTPERTIHLYHCDHRGLPLALVSIDGKIEWSVAYDAWGNVLRENNPHNMKQLIRLPGQQYDEETGLYYNRHRYYDPLQGRCITQDPIGLRGGWRPYAYPLNPVMNIDPLGLSELGELDSLLNQPGMKDAYNRAAAQYENSLPKPVSDWKFIRWDVSKGGPFWNKYVNVNAMCEDQFGNNKVVGAKYFQRGLFDINEDTPKGLYAGFETHPVDAIFDIAEASSRAKKCGSKNGFICFMDTEATPILGGELCRGGK